MKNLEKITIVGGCGHVGLPLGIVLASKAGLQVDLLDIDPSKVDMVNSGTMPFMERGADELLRKVVKKSLKATLDPTCISQADAVITVVGTPVDRHLNPTVGEVYRSIDALLDHMQDGTLLVLRSTVYPGVTKLVHERLRRLNRKVLLAFCPERIAEGNAIEELIKLPQIVSAFEPEATAAAGQLFGMIAPKLIELTPHEAEAGEAVYQRLAIRELRHLEPVLHAGRKLRPRLLPDSRCGHSRLSAHAQLRHGWIRGGTVPAERHAATGSVLAEQFLPRPCRHVDQRRASYVPGRAASQPRVVRTSAWQSWEWRSKRSPTTSATASPTS